MDQASKNQKENDEYLSKIRLKELFQVSKAPAIVKKCIEANITLYQILK